MGRKKRYYNEWREEEKAHNLLPTKLNIGVQEELTDRGLFIYFASCQIKHPKAASYPYVILGQYAEPQYDGSVFYVADWTLQCLNPTTTKHEHLLQAIAKIMQIAGIAE